MAEFAEENILAVKPVNSRPKLQMPISRPRARR